MKILVISPVPTHPKIAGNSSRILKLIEALLNLGHDVHFLHVNFQPGDENSMRSRFGKSFHIYNYQKPWRKYKLFGVPIPDRISRRILKYGWLTQRVDQFYDYGLDDYLRQLHEEHQFDVAIVEYVFFSQALNALPSSVHKIIDTHDVYTNRSQILIQNDMNVDWFFTTQDEEVKGLQRANTIIAIQENEKVFFQSILPAQSRILTVGHLLNPIPFQKPGLSQSILMVGSLNPINLKYFQQFLDECWGPLKVRLPNLTLKIVGGVCAELVPNTACEMFNFVDDLEQIYSETDLVVNPLMVGTGLKIKSLEALSHGRALIATAAGLEGLEESIGHGAELASTFPLMAKRIELLFSEPNRLIDMSQSAARFATEYKLKQIDALELAIMPISKIPSGISSN